MLIERDLLGTPGLPWLPTLVRDAPAAVIFVVGMDDHPRLDAQARRAGAAGYIRVDEAAAAVAGSIPAAIAG
jgi:hypothetical protein